MKIGIVGGGTVGRATARTYLEWAEEVRVYDKIKERRTHSLRATLMCDVVFVCLPETEIESFCAGLCEGEFDSPECNLVLRSTVPIGTTRKLAEKHELVNLVHSPEFLTERCALTDAQIPSRNIVGLTGSRFDALLLRELYEARFPEVPVLVMSSDESEAVKLFQNAFFAVKVSFWNEVYALAEKMDLNWDTVMDGILSDGRIAPSHTRVPGPDSKFGFGGRCLPKDLKQLVEQIEHLGLAPPIMRAAMQRNAWDREREA